MPRIDIELTSSRPDGTWTWRAAGARQPKGVVSASVLHDGAKVGDVLKAEADFDLDGINVTSVTAPKAKKKAAADAVLPILGSGKEEALVTHSPLKPEREGADRGRRGERGERGGRGDRFGGGGFGGGGGGRGERGPVGPDGRPLGPGATRPRATPGPSAGPRDGRGPGGPGQRERTRPDRPERPRSERPAGDRPERPRSERPAGDRPPRDSAGPPREGAGRRDRPARPPATAAPARPRPQAKRLQPGRAHRDAFLAELAPEQRAIADQVLRGGLPGVRVAVEEQNKEARAAGGPEIRADAILSLAEELHRGLRAAEWRDKAEAAAAIVDEIGLRDLRAVVNGADAAGRDEASRALVTSLREGLERRSAAERQAWVDEIGTCLTEGRVVRALRVSSRAPEQGLRLPPELGTGLSTAAGDAMSAETAPDRWLAVLEAVLASPVRRSIVPKGLPNGADEATLKTLRQAIPKVPALAPLLGESPSSRPVPPPPPRRPPAPPAPAAEAPAPASEPEVTLPAAEETATEPAFEPQAAADPEPAQEAPAAEAPGTEPTPEPQAAGDPEPSPEAPASDPSPPAPDPDTPLLVAPDPPPAPGAAPPLVVAPEPPPPMGTVDDEPEAPPA